MFNVADQTPSIKPARAFGVVAIAIVIVLVAIAAYVLMNRVSPTAAGNISDIWLYQPLPAKKLPTAHCPRRATDSSLSCP